ncbi:MAG: Lrp/AsnC family transcriptional regulator [Candidatus Protistobacter heckmanni]|nr:Lrp/AsnC family transcriptional regulator [Candidatus Protistobacter heckmanni]
MDKLRPQLDGFDLRLLELLQQNNQLTHAELAEQVSLSPASCQRRVARLRNEKVIQRDVAIVDPAALGRELLLVVLVSLEREQSNLIGNFKDSVRKAAEILQCYYVTGNADFVLVISVRNMEEYEKFTEAFFFDNPNVRNFQTMVVMNRVKYETSLPVRDAAEGSAGAAGD